MNKKEVMEIIDENWIRKPKGYRVHFQDKEDNAWRSVYAPNDGQDPYDSDVVAWRIAWKLSQAAQSSEGAPEMVNIYVVDDTGAPIKYYATGDYYIFIRHNTT